MRCPSCRHLALEYDQACRQCGFSLDALAQSMGIPPMLNAPLADLANRLSSGERRSVHSCIQALHGRFPQLSFAAVLMEVSPTMPHALQAFWLFNRCSLFSVSERAGDNHGILLLLDTSSDRAVSMIGYGLEPFVSEQTLEVCLTAASASLGKSQYGAAIEAFVRELERQLTQIVAQLSRAFGYTDSGLWQDPGTASDSLSTVESGEMADVY